MDDAKSGKKRRQRSKFTSPIRLNTFKFGGKLSFDHGDEVLKYG